MKLYVGIFFFFLAGPLVLAQDSLRVPYWNDQFVKHISTDFDMALQAAQESFKESKKFKNDSQLLLAHKNLGEIYWELKKIDSAKTHTKKALEYVQVHKNDSMHLVLCRQWGHLLRYEGSTTEAFSFYEKAKGIANKNNWNSLEAATINDISKLIKSVNGNRETARQEVFKALKLLKVTKNSSYSIECYDQMGLLYFRENKDSAAFYYQKALEICKKTNNIKWEGRVVSNLGDLYLSMKKFEEGIEYLHKAEKLTKKVGDKNNLHFINVSLGIYYEYLDNFPEAIAHYQIALDDYGEFVDNKQIARISQLLSGALYHSDNYERAYHYLEAYSILRDTILSTEKTKQFDELRIQYEVAEKNSQIIQLENKQLLSRQNRNRIIFGGVLGLVLVSFIAFLYRQRLRSQKTQRSFEKELHIKETERLEKEKEVKLAQALIEGQEQEKERIAKELHDGLGGQLASIKMQLSNINEAKQDTSIQNVEIQLEEAFTELRTISHHLSSHYTENKNFEDLVFQLLTFYRKQQIFQVEWSLFPQQGVENFHGETKHHLYRIIQELLANTAKHANASLVSLSLTFYENRAVFMYEDNGKGFVISKITRGLGLQNIEQRAKSIAATLTVESQPEKGIHILMEFSINRNNKEDGKN